MLSVLLIYPSLKAYSLLTVRDCWQKCSFHASFILAIKFHDMTLLIFAVMERKHFGQNDSTSRNCLPVGSTVAQW